MARQPAGALALILSVVAVGQLFAQAPARIEFRWAESEPIDRVTELEGIELSCMQGKAYLHSSPILTRGDIASAKLDLAGDYALILVSLKEEASKRLEAASVGNLDKPLVVLVDGKVVAAMVVKSKLSTEVPLGPIEVKEAHRLVKLF
jgi:preprotein translocase subunit SecD